MWSTFWRGLSWLRGASLASARKAHFSSEGRALPPRLPLHVWGIAALLFLSTYVFMWSFVHVRVDLRPCALVLDDPLFRLIGYDRRWFWVTHELYSFFTLSVLAALVLEAFIADERPLVVWGTSLALQAALRSVTLLLLPLCRANVLPGTSAISRVPYLDLGAFSIPWRVWASNDLVFSGHIGEFLLISWCTRHWPRPLRLLLIAFQLVQAYALLATHGHYTIDLVLAVPCALFEFRVALALLTRLVPARLSPPAGERARLGLS